jgi:hypothetical protein
MTQEGWMDTMRKRLGIAVAGLALVLVLTGAPSASASIEAGDDCVANTAEGIYTLVQMQRASSSALPLTAPASGVVTSWKVNSGVSEGVPEQMRVLRPTDVPNQFLTVGESTEQTVVNGTNVFPTRIPVQAGDHFGAFGTVQDVVYCLPADPGDIAGFFILSAAVGSEHLFTPETGVRVAMIAVIEPDKDGDGYGDETQDKCPQSAAYQGPCPAIALDAFPIVLKRSVLVLVSSSASTPVQVFGQVGLKLAPKPGGPAHISKTRKPGKPTPTGQIFGLSGDTQTVNPGEVARFNVKLPKTVKRYLGQLPPKKSLRASITASATDLAGRISTKILSLRLPGQKRLK